MSGPELVSALRSTDHDFIAGIRFLDAIAKHLNSHHGYSSDDLGHRFVPRFDLEDHEHAYELYGELPGFDKEHITVEANDDHNIQISGWIPRRHGDVATSGIDTIDPYLKVQHHDVPQQRHHSTMERFGEALNPHREPPSDGPEISQSPQPADPAAPVPKPPHEDRPETARFGDVLNPHANFVHRPKDKPKFKYLISERLYGQFHRTFHFPAPIKKEEVSARMDNGILHITAPKAAVPPPTKIEIKKGPQS